MLYVYVVSKMSSRNQRLSIFSPTPSSTSFFSTVFCLHFGIVFYTRASLVAQIGEGNGTPLQYSCLENPMAGGACWAAVHGVAKGQTRLSNFTFTFHFHALEKEMATHSSALAWRVPGTGEPGGLLSMGSHRVWRDWSDLAAAAAVAQMAKNQPARQETWIQLVG